MSDLQASLAERMEQVQWHGDRYFSAICPFPHDGHIETHASLLIYADGFSCMGCGRHGTLKYLASKVSKSSNLTSSVKVTIPVVLPKWRKWAYRFGDVPEIARAGHKYLKAFKGHQIFFKYRKIDQFIDAGQFGYIDGWLLFPVFDQTGKVIDIVVRAGAGKSAGIKYVVKPDSSRKAPNIYVPNWKRVLESDTVYVPYGMIDAWTFEDLGLPAITGTTGKSLSALQIKPLMNKRIIIVPDRYEESAAYELSKELGMFSKVKLLKWPEGAKDPDDIRRMLGKDALMGLLS